MAKAKKAKKVVKKLDIAEHEHRIWALGLSERAKRLIFRATLILIPLMFLVYWILRTAK